MSCSGQNTHSYTESPPEFQLRLALTRGDVLKQVLDIPLKDQRRNATSHITEVFFYLYDAKALFNDAFAQRWCEPIAQRVRQVINDRVGEMITDLSEPEYFFRGEFVLALTYIDVGMSGGEPVDSRVPLPGLYLYMHDAHEVVTGLLLDHPDWIDTTAVRSRRRRSAVGS